MNHICVAYFEIEYMMFTVFAHLILETMKIHYVSKAVLLYTYISNIYLMDAVGPHSLVDSQLDVVGSKFLGWKISGLPWA